MDYPGAGEGNGKKDSDFIGGMKLLYQLGDCWLLQKDCSMEFV